MGKKAAKSTRKFAASGQLKKTIQQRRKHQDMQRKIQKRKGKSSSSKQAEQDEHEGEEDEDDRRQSGSKLQGMSVDDLLGAGFMNDSDEDAEEDAGDASDDEDMDEDAEDEEIEDDQSFASVDELEDNEGESHMFELAKLAEKDPEFYKYLKENDKELLEFNPDALQQDEDMSDAQDEDEEETERAPPLTMQQLRKWSEALLKQRSLRALRRLLIAFRAAVHMNEDDQVLAWTIDSSAVYQKLVRTALKFTPMILEHHCPSKTLPNGGFKPPVQNHKWKTLQRMILSFFHNIIHLLPQLTDNALLELATTESAKLVPYIMGGKRTVKLYLKTCLNLWSSAEDNVRIASFLAIRKLAMSPDESILNMVLKNIYLTLVRSCKSTTVHTLPSINLMKNSASEIYTINHVMAYQHAFGYIRQLAILLRNSMKTKTKDAYKQVYNWQYVHCVDFWALVLARACGRDASVQSTSEDNEMKALIYPLVQVSTGAIKLLPTSRSYPFHFHIIRSLLHLAQHTNIYIPLTPFLFPILTSTLSSISKPKASTLRPLNFDTTIRAPQQYLKTRVFSENLAEECCFLLAEFLASPAVHTSVAFPEIVVPVSMALRKMVKAANGASWKMKEVGLAKALVERVQESGRWMELRRKGVSFGPGKMDEVLRWESEIKAEETPLGRFVKVLRKAREKRQKLLEKARHGEDEILET